MALVWCVIHNLIEVCFENMNKALIKSKPDFYSKKHFKSLYFWIARKLHKLQ